MEHSLEFILTRLLPGLVAAGGALGWFLERRKRKADAHRTEAEASAIEADSRIKVEGAEVSHVSSLLDKAERLADKALAYHQALMECQQMKMAAEIRAEDERRERGRVESYAEGLRRDKAELQRQVTDLNARAREGK